MAIIYTPEGRIDAQNHPHRVYYSCHKDDHVLLGEVAQQLRQFMEDCVIAFREPRTDVEPTHLDEVESFPLVVIPVTQSWFREGVHQQEFARLKEQKKPMIPILFDDSLVERFNAHTNEMQFLRYDDPEYSEKLNRALQSMLLDQKTVDEVHKVFTHKLFIAYCREDIEQVGKLIRCIHQSEEGRYISIWFDKYLQTGRNFEEVIFSQLDNSQMFGMVLTHSLVQRDTYVKNREYPRALAKDKKIIVFQFSDADWDTLRTELDKISLENKIPLPNHQQPVWVRRDDSFSSYIKKLMKEVKGKSTIEKQRDRDYLLGLAYRNGIGVEFDYHYAMKKFKAAAGKGKYQAAHCLAEMFYYGIGVHHDLKKAKKWYIQEIEYLFEEYTKSVTEIKTIPVPILQLENGMRVDMRNKIKDEAKEFILNMAGCLVEQACLNARILRDIGDWDGAKHLYQLAQKALRWSENNVNQIGVTATYGIRLENEINQFLLWEEQDLQAYAKNWNQARDTWREDDSDSCFDAVKSGHNYAVMLLKEGNSETARQVMEQALRLIERTRVTLPQNIREIQLLLYRDIGQSYLLQNPQDKTLRREFADKMRINVQNMLQLFEEYPFDMEENPYLRTLIPWAGIFKAEASFYEKDDVKAFQLYIMALEEVKKTQAQLGDVAFQRDWPVSFLQMYAHIATSLNRFLKIPKKIIECYRGILEQFETLNYNEKHQTLAQEYFKKIHTALNI